MKIVSITDRSALLALPSNEFGPWGPKLKITWWRIFLYAFLSGDYQWIHINFWRSWRGPYKTLIAQGGLIAALLKRIVGPLPYQISDVVHVIDRGRDKVKQKQVVRLGQYIRARQRVFKVRIQRGLGVYVVIIVQVAIVGHEDTTVLESRVNLVYSQSRLE